MSDLRKYFFEELIKIAKKDKDVHLLVGDLGYPFIEEYKKELPDQFTNVGISEQNMVGIAAGMAIAGKKPYCYSGAVFILARAYEQIRDDVCYNNSDVKLVGTSAADFLGFTHNFKGDENEEDLLKNLPNIKRFYTNNIDELKQALNCKGPSYIRL